MLRNFGMTTPYHVNVNSVHTFLIFVVTTDYGSFIMKIFRFMLTSLSTPPPHSNVTTPHSLSSGLPRELQL